MNDLIITPALIGGFFAVMSRLGAFFMAFPLINTRMIPLNIRIFLTISLSFFVTSLLKIQIPIENMTLIEISFFVLKEILLGFFMATITAIFLGIVSYAAELISYSMGLTVANMFDPTFGVISVIDRFYILVFYIVFFVSGSYKFLIGGAVASFKVVPPDKLLSFDYEGLFKFFISKSSLLFSLSFQLAFPIMLTLFIINIALALVNRLIPQINVFIVGLPLQIFTGLVALVIGFSAIVYAISSLINIMISEIFTILKLVGA